LRWTGDGHTFRRPDIPQSPARTGRPEVRFAARNFRPGVRCSSCSKRPFGSAPFGQILTVLAAAVCSCTRPMRGNRVHVYTREAFHSDLSVFAMPSQSHEARLGGRHGLRHGSEKPGGFPVAFCIEGEREAGDRSPVPVPALGQFSRLRPIGARERADSDLGAGCRGERACPVRPRTRRRAQGTARARPRRATSSARLAIGAGLSQ